jgi:hypothetical protein
MLLGEVACESIVGVSNQGAAEGNATLAHISGAMWISVSC